MPFEVRFLFSIISRLMGYAGKHKYFTYASWLLSATSAFIALLPFVYIWKTIKEVLDVAPNFSSATRLIHNGLMVMIFAIVSFLVYIGALVCSHLAAFRVATNMRIIVGVVMYLMQIFTAIEIGFSMGSTLLVGYNYGAENHDELKNLFKKSMILMSISGVVLCGLAEALTIPIAKIFAGYDAELCALTIKAIRICSFAFILSGITIYSSGFFTALNNGTISAVLAFLRSLVFQIGFILVLPIFFELNGVWWAMCATEISSFLFAVIFFIAMRKKYQYT